jgi:predicted nuclease of predicted toxin-antitoxin system
VSVRFKVDEDLPRQIAQVLTDRGNNATTVVEQGWQGLPDEILWQQIQAEGRWLITGDKGFADLRLHPPGTHAGVILLRPQEESRRAYLDLVEAALDRLDLDNLPGAVVVVTHRGLRIRRPAKDE